MGSNCGPRFVRSMTLQPLVPGSPLKKNSPPLSTPGLSADRRSITIWHHSRSWSYSVIFLYSQRRPSCRRHTRPRTRSPEIDSLGIITDQRCQNSAPAGCTLRVSGGSIAVNKVMSSSVSNQQIHSRCVRTLSLTGHRPATSRYLLRGREQPNSLVKIDVAADC